MKYHRKPIIGIMGPGDPAEPSLLLHAEELGKSIAENDWILLTGGRKAGVMDAASKGAYDAGGIVVGILPGDNHSGISEFVTIPVITGMGHARNVINILTADVVVVCGMGHGTVSEAALALKQNKPVIFTKAAETEIQFFNRISDKQIDHTDSIDQIISLIRKQLPLVGF